MRKFVDLFKQEFEEKPLIVDFLLDIEQALKDSERLIGYRIDFDLESLMVVLEDVAKETGRPISPPTFAFTLNLLAKKEKTLNEYSIQSIRKRYETEAKELLAQLQNFIFDKCIEPIKNGQKNNSFLFLDLFYGPLFTLIDSSIAGRGHSWIFTTNWDLCLKQWLEYSQIPFEDGTSQGTHRKTVLNPSTGWGVNTPQSATKVVPLHGSFDLLNCKRLVSGKAYLEIEKVSKPEVYFEGKRSEISKAFIVYPLEAVGYDQTIKSPYLDMLTQLKKSLREENRIFVIGFSFRDSIIASIFDEVVREKLEMGRGDDMKVMLIDSNPKSVAENLKRQGYTNVANVIIDAQVTFPDVLQYNTGKPEITQSMQAMLAEIAERMDSTNIHFSQTSTNQRLEKYGLRI